MKRTWFPTVVLFTLLVSAPTTRAVEFVERAEVIRVEPIGGAPVSKRCVAPKPRTTDLVSLLRWDLCTEPVESRPSAYRVYYRWDGRTYDRVMKREPGPTVPIKIRLD